MYKYVAITLSIALAVSLFLYVREQNKRIEETTSLKNKISEQSVIIKEAENLYSKKVVELSGLESTNKDLKKLLDKRDEDIVSLNSVILKLKKKKIVDDKAKETTEESDTGIRHRVDFDKTQDYLRVHGYTKTNPPLAEINIEWVKPLHLELVLTRDKNKDFKVYVNTDNSDVVPTDMKLFVDPSIFHKKWYEKISVTAALSFGKLVNTGTSLNYDWTNALSFGPQIDVIFSELGVDYLYGLSLTWRPFASDK